MTDISQSMIDEARAELLAGVVLSRAEWLCLSPEQAAARIIAGGEIHDERCGIVRKSVWDELEAAIDAVTARAS